MEEQTISVTPSELAGMIGAAVKAAVEGVRAEDERKAKASAKAERDAAMARIREDKELAEHEAARPPRRSNVEKKEVDDLARKFRPGSNVKVMAHRRFRAAAYRADDDTMEPPRMGAVQPDEVVTLPVHPEAIGSGQSPRELAHMSLAGMFELAS